MIRSCPSRLEFKNECYSTVNQSISKNIDICINFMGRTKTKPFLKRKRVQKLLSLLAPQKMTSLLLFNTYLVMWKYNCEPLWLNRLKYFQFCLLCENKVKRLFCLTKHKTVNGKFVYWIEQCFNIKLEKSLLDLMHS